MLEFDFVKRAAAMAIAAGLVVGAAGNAAAADSLRDYRGGQQSAARDRPYDVGMKPGDLVRVRSGGPLMTVKAVDGGQVATDWATVDGRLVSGTFNVTDLRKIGGAEPPRQSEGPYRYRPCPAEVADNGKVRCQD